ARARRREHRRPLHERIPARAGRPAAGGGRGVALDRCVERVARLHAAERVAEAGTRTAAQRMMREPGELWPLVAARIHPDRGWLLRPLARLGRPRAHRCTRLARGEPGVVVVKVSVTPFAAERAVWATEALALLLARGAPVPELLWSGRVDERWLALVQSLLPGEPLRALDRPTLDRLLALVERQADLGLPAITAAEDELRAVAGLGRGTVRIGAFLSAANSFVPAALARFTAPYPAVERG